MFVYNCCNVLSINCLMRMRIIGSTQKVKKWDFRAVGNNILWLTPCGDWSKNSGERRRGSIVVASIVLTTTDPLRGS